MTLLIVGLAVFLGAHSLGIVADGWRARVIAKRGPGLWKGLYTLVSIAGLVLIVVGYGQARGGMPLLIGGTGTRYVAYTLIWLGFVGVTAAYWPHNHIKPTVGDPMVAGVGLWALGHLLVETTPAALTLFGAFLVWALIDYISLRARAAAALTAPSKASVLQTFLTVVAGSTIWAVFALFLHKWLIGISPMG